MCFFFLNFEISDMSAFLNDDGDSPLPVTPFNPVIMTVWMGGLWRES